MGRIGITDSSIYEGIANEVREALGEAEQYAPAQLVNKVGDVYAKGYEVGKAEGGNSQESYDEGYEAAYQEINGLNAELEQTLSGGDTGGKGHYDEFWDTFQDNGNRTYYYVAFSYPPTTGGWNDETYNPKYPIIGEGTYGLYGVFRNQTSITDVKVPVIAKTSSIEGCFQNASGIITIPSLILEVPVTAGVNAFLGCTKLTNLNIECVDNGCFATSLSFQYDGKLSKASITSIVNALSTTTTGLTVTFSTTAINNAFPDQTEWAALKATRTNWKYALA